jgi:hypothetical protein
MWDKLQYQIELDTLRDKPTDQEYTIDSWTLNGKMTSGSEIKLVVSKITLYHLWSGSGETSDSNWDDKENTIKLTFQGQSFAAGSPRNV